MPSTARPRRICGRPWRSRQISITCSAIRTSVKIRPRSDSSGPQTTGACAWTSGHFVQKFSGFGELPNKHFCGALGPAKISSVPTLELLAETRNPGSSAKKQRRVFLFTHPPFPWPLSSPGSWLLQFSVLFRPGR